jgi:hypothetical protein
VARLIARIKGDVKDTAQGNKGGRPSKPSVSNARFSDPHDNRTDAILGRYAGVSESTARKLREMVEAIQRDPETFGCLQDDLDGANHPHLRRGPAAIRHADRKADDVPHVAIQRRFRKFS